jgi:hypothetical protein
MVIDTLFKSRSGTLYAGTGDGGNKFSGRMVKDGRITGKMQDGIPGTLVATFVTPFELAGRVLPLHADIRIDGRMDRLGRYLTPRTRENSRGVSG